MATLKFQEKNCSLPIVTYLLLGPFLKEAEAVKIHSDLATVIRVMRYKILLSRMLPRSLR
jgi:hypothetical protein